MAIIKKKRSVSRELQQLGVGRNAKKFTGRNSYERQVAKVRKVAIRQGCFGPRWTSEPGTISRCKKVPENVPILSNFVSMADEIADIEMRRAWEAEYRRRMEQWLPPSSCPSLLLSPTPTSSCCSSTPCPLNIT